MHRIVGAAIAALLLLGACGPSEVGDVAPRATGAGDTVDGRVFLSRSVTGRELVEGTEIRLTFRDGQLGATAGCNSLGSPYAIRDDTLVVTGEGMSMTEIGCDPDRHDQDTWLAAFLSGEPRIELEGDELTLSRGSTTIVLVDREVADPDRELIGTTWEVDTVVSGETASSAAPGVTLTFPDRETFTAGSEGCTSVEGSMRLGEGTITFGDFAVRDIGCPHPWAETLEVIGSGETSYTIEASRLTIEAGDAGIGAVAQVR